MDTTNKVFFLKELVSNAYMIKGAVVPFEILAENQGVIALDPATQSDLIAALNTAATERRGGIVKISGEDYEKKKREQPFDPSRIKPREMLRVMRSIHDLPSPFNREKAPVAASVEPPPQPQLTAPPAPDNSEAISPLAAAALFAQSQPPGTPPGPTELKLNLGKPSERARARAAATPAA